MQWAPLINLLEATRQEVPRAVFVHMSTNKVYGDRPNSIRLKEMATRWDYNDPRYSAGIAKNFPIEPRCGEVLQHWGRQAKQHLHHRSFPAYRGPDSKKDEVRVRRKEPGGRSHLLRE